LLPSKSKVQAIEHHPAMPYGEVGGFITQLRDLPNINARALEFLILTVARSFEVIGALWDEVDIGAKVWTVPASRMKGKKEHRVPLTAAALAVLKQMEAIRQSDYIFPGIGGGRLGINSLSELLAGMVDRGIASVHGFRSTFRDWAAERTSFPREVVEMALAHSVGSDVEQAYRRTDLFDKRRRLMEEWAKFCSKAPTRAAGEVVALRGVS
jgi:integrase